MKFKWVKWLWLNWDRWSHSNCNYNSWGYGFDRVYLFHRWTPFLIGYVHMLPTAPERQEGYIAKGLRVVENCRKYGLQDCHTCPDLDCCDNTDYIRQLRNEKALNKQLERKLGSEKRLSDNRRFHLAASEKELVVHREHIRVLGDANKELWDKLDWVFSMTNTIGDTDPQFKERLGVIHMEIYGMLRAKERADDEQSG